MATKRKPINRTNLPYDYFMLGQRKYRVLHWGTFGKTLIVRVVMTCSNHPDPSLKLGSKMSNPFEMDYPINSTITKFKSFTMTKTIEFSYYKSNVKNKKAKGSPVSNLQGFTKGTMTFDTDHFRDDEDNHKNMVSDHLGDQEHHMIKIIPVK